MSTEWYRSQFPGVRFRENPSKKYNGKPDRYFTIRYKLNGILKEEGLGWSSQGWNAQKASITRNDLLKGHKTGEGPTTLAEKRKIKKAKQDEDEIRAEMAAKENVTFREFFANKYLLNANINKSRKAIDCEETLLRLWMDSIIGELRLKDIAQSHLEQIIREMLKAGKAARYVRYALAVVRQVFNYARYINFYTGPSPVENVKFPQADNKRLRFLTRDEAVLLLQELKKRSFQLYEIAFMSLRTGARADEIFSLKWGDVDFSKGTLTLWDTKNTKTRIVRMTEDIKQMLQEMRSPDFLPSEFHSRIPLNRLCSKIHADFHDYFDHCEKSVGWLNFILTNTSLNELFVKKHQGNEYSDKLKVLVDQCKLLRSKNYNELTLLEQDSIKRLNRLLIEETYSMFTPKNVAKTDRNIQDHVFVDDTGKKIAAVSSTFARTVNVVGLNEGITDRRMKVVFHTLRHTYASWLVEKGVDLYTVKELLGHSSLTMTERYSHVGENALTSAVRKLEKIDLDLAQKETE
jgi:integrase